MRRGSIAAVLILAGAMMSPQIASADVFVGQTNLTIHVQENVITGMLVGRPECRGNQVIDLYVGGVLTDSTTTDGSGNYAFSITLGPPTTAQTQFAGSEIGVHPDRFTCTPSESRVVQVDKVKTANGPSKLNLAAESLALRVESAATQALRAISLLA